MPRKKAITPQKELFQQSPEDACKERETAADRDDDGPASSSPKSFSPFCFPLLHNSCAKQHATETLPMLHDQWQESQRGAATKLSRQIQTKRALDSIVDVHLAGLRAHYTRSMLPSHPRDVPCLLFPSWKPPFLTASLSWLGDTWRPSSILSLVVPTLSSPLSPKKQRLLHESIRRLRVQEIVLDEEMAEYQSMSVLNLLRKAAKDKPVKGKRGAAAGGGKMEAVVEEMRKVEGVVQRAQKMRYKAVEVAVRGGVLDDTQAAEFLVALAGVEEAVERQAAGWRARVGDVFVKVQAFD